MKNTLLRYSWILILFAFFDGFAQDRQENLINRTIENVKSNGIRFEPATAVFSKVEKKRNFQDLFLIQDAVSYFHFNKSNVSNIGKAITLTIPTNNKNLELELLEVPPSFYDYEIVTDKGEKKTANKKYKHFRGIVKGDPTSVVAISFLENEVAGFIATDKGNFNIAYEKQSEHHIVYNDKNFSKKKEFKCATNENLKIEYNPKILKSNTKNELLLANKRCVRLYFETEYNIFQ